MAYPLRGLTRRVVRDALLHTTVASLGVWVSCHLPVSLALLLWPLSLTRRFCSQNRRSLDVFLFCFSHHSLRSLELCMEIAGDQQFLRGSNHPACHQTIIPWSKSLWSPFFPILTFGDILTSVPLGHVCCYAFSCCHTIGRIDIRINRLVYRST